MDIFGKEKNKFKSQEQHLKQTKQQHKITILRY